ncbi:transcriptional regulator [Methylobacterium sp. NEAU 140]|uniref:transcriptional regulator n=1 Tax=Methylobacterium sp. NEAU 140 TaxID=3064945 RepID=UPI002734492F|nr:transcriptional regulator [Methylobacterium sp. NEAU 140]MDP4024428.1 transcriptional regulator [Methylobacterium sp. NEAU 140]
METDRREFAHERACLECGTPFTPRKSDAEFCAAGCRQSWNNRRLQRGAEVYDLLMALRWDRAVATGLHVFTALSRMAAGFRRQDIAERDGRRSWTPPAAVIARKPHLRAQALAQVRKPAS